jgi:Transmembrane domain of unknown function (DUF3566)
VNDTTRTPDEPDRPVVADDQVRDTSDSAGNGTKPRKSGSAGKEAGGSAADGVSRKAADSPAAKAGAADAARSSGSAGSARGSGATGAAEVAAAASPAAEPSARAAERPPAEAVDPAAMTTPAMSLRPAQEPSAAPTPPEGKPEVRSTSSTGARKAARQEPGTLASGLPRSTPSFAKADDEPTTRMRFPAAANGNSPAPDQMTQPVARQSTAAVPMPGPAADAPPPWNRVPGQEPSPVLVENRPAEAAVEEVDGPTAFLDPPAPPPPNDRKPGRPSGTAPPSRGGRTRPPRQASLQLKRLDPWSVLKLALVLAVVLFLIWLVAVGVLYGVLDGIGVWDRLNGTYADLVSGEAPSGSPLISAGRVFGIAAVVGAVNSLLFAVAVTVGAFVYNVSADLVGGIEVTLSERD